MRVIVAADRAAASKCAADVVERFVRGQQRVGLGVATGSTTEALYTELARRHRREGLSFAGVDVYLLDEYVGLDPGDPRRFCSVVQRELAQQVDLRRDAVHCPDPDLPDLASECCRYEHSVRSAPIGLQILGIGSNGHIAFNEPGSAIDSVTRIVTLSERTRADNARFFGDGRPVPERAVTQGISTILAAVEVLLLACGERKAAAVAAAVHGPLCETAPPQRCSSIRARRSSSTRVPHRCSSDRSRSLSRCASQTKARSSSSTYLTSTNPRRRRLPCSNLYGRCPQLTQSRIVATVRPGSAHMQ